ncbi:GMC oxidoreductase [Polyporus arcularius HHB13444]|uniref:GMC oxidoreductase n=1 Tax=Polyporus arcularius HHB13444 TaxID=1314778 RepID=A0A5C3PR21_9APHY|nr:GMC oxidoreductase [Polyporus arcularius HHB13444]
MAMVWMCFCVLEGLPPARLSVTDLPAVVTQAGGSETTARRRQPVLTLRQASRRPVCDELYHVGPSKLEVDVWSTLLNGTSKWNWDALFTGTARRSITLTLGPTCNMQAIGKMKYDASSRGTNRPIQSWDSSSEFSTLGNCTATLANAGVDVCWDAYSGDPFGAYIATNSINPANWMCSYSRSRYIDPLPPRDNLAILSNATVTRLLFDHSNASTLIVTTVE